MAFSSLIKSQILSPNYNERTEKICKITPHHAAGVLSAETLASIFSKKSRQASCNYAIGNDGTIIGVVDETRRAWTSSSRWNDQRAVTIEVSNSATGGQWPVSDAALNSLINLCVDICKRNGMKKLEFTGTKDGSLTMHKMFAATSCPGPYLESKFPYIAERVNAILKPPAPAPVVENKPAATTTTSAKKSNEEIAKEVINGKWGNGAVRKNKLTAAGYDYATIQGIVDNLVKAQKSGAAKTTTAAKPAASTAVYYTVKRNDTLGAIAKRYRTTVNAIMALNKGLIKNANVIRVGWKIRVK